MGLFTKTGEDSPDIIYTQEFRVANGVRYLGYMERENAVSPEQENDLQRERNVQNDPDVGKNFKGYLGYTDRKAATKMEDDLTNEEKGDYPTFTQGSYELSEKQHQELINNLRQAQKNKSLLWAGVISFSPEFIEKSGLMNADGSVNQKAIKTAVMNAMPDYLKAEGLDNPQTFWWGDIHLNTNHVHVHLAISQKKNTRPLKENGEPKGMFHTKSIRKLKSILHHELANEESRTRTIALEKSLDYHKGVMKNLESRLIKQDQQLEKLLVNLQQTLPDYKDKRKWRASNHSVDFKESRELAYDLVDYLLDHQLSNSYAFYTNSSQQLDEVAKVSYGNNIKDTVQPRDDKLRDQLVNLLFTNLRDYESKRKLYKKDRLQILKDQGPELNKRIMKAEETALKSMDGSSDVTREIRMRLGLRRYYLKLYNLDQQIDDLTKRIDGLYSLGELTKLSPFIRYYQEQQVLLKIEKKPQRGLTQQEKELQTVLRGKYQDVKKLSIEKATPDRISKRLEQLKKEQQLLKSNRKDPGIKYITSDLKQLLNQYQDEIKVLQIKGQIHENNNKLPLNERKRVNGPLFQELKKIYLRIEDPANHPNRPIVDYLDKHLFNKQLPESKKSTKREPPKRSAVLAQGITRSLSNLIESSKSSSKYRSKRALRERLDKDDDLEREDEKERRREER